MIRIFEWDTNKGANAKEVNVRYLTNGIGTLSPTKCTVTETLNGEYELVMEHPFDELGKWKRIQKHRIIVAPVPRAPHPIMKATGVNNSGVYHYYRLADIDGPQQLRRGPSLEYEKSGTEYLPGTEFRVRAESTENGILRYIEGGGGLISEAEPGWASVDTPTAINAGYIHMRYLRYSRSEDGIGATEGIRDDIVVPDLNEDTTRYAVGDQAFRIYKVEIKIDSIVVYARHISYDYGESYVPYCNVKPLLTSTTDPAGRAMYLIMINRTQVSGSVEWYMYENMEADSAHPVPEEWIYERKTLTEILLGDGGMTDLFGGEVMRDNNDMYWLRFIGRNRGVYVKSGKNLTGITFTEDWSEVVNRIMPIGKNDDGDDLYLNGKTSITNTAAALYVTKNAISEVPFYRTAVLNDDECNTVAKLKSAANAEFEKGCDQPNITVSLKFELLGESEEYAQYRKLQGIFLGDTVYAKSSMANIDVPIKMTQYTYDCLTERYTSMTLGTPEKVDLKV